MRPSDKSLAKSCCDEANLLTFAFVSRERVRFLKRLVGQIVVCCFSRNYGWFCRLLFVLFWGVVLTADPFRQWLSILVLAVFDAVAINVAPCNRDGQDEHG